MAIEYLIGLSKISPTGMDRGVSVVALLETSKYTTENPYVLPGDQVDAVARILAALARDKKLKFGSSRTALQ